MTLRARRMATQAFSRVSARTLLNAEERKKYGSLAHKLPGMVLQSGLAQSTGFLLAKGHNADENVHSLLLDDLHFVLRAGHDLRSTSRLELHERILKANLTETLGLTRAALEASGWLKRYVQGVLRVDATGEVQSSANLPEEHN
jgi:CRISPR-associated protein Cmr5